MDISFLLLCEYNEKMIKLLNDKKLLSDDAIKRINIYKFYSNLLKTGIKNMDAYTITAEKFSLSEDRIIQIITGLNKKGVEDCIN